MHGVRMPAIFDVVGQTSDERKEAKMRSPQNAARTLQVKTGQDAYSLGPGEGDTRWVMGELDTIKATAAQTGGLFGLKESKAPRGGGPPLHVHEHEDEACYVLEGEVTFFVGEDVIPASAGAWVYLPRRIPHSLRIESGEARTLWLVVPGGFESFFVDTFPAAVQGSSRSEGSPDAGQMAEAAARYDVTILGPPPGEKS
jgi:quercetin dioxygenase-like cupin family protein